MSVLIKQKADVNKSRFDIKATPLYVAAERGFKEIVEELLKNGADPNLTLNSGSSPLIIATLNGHTEVVALLLKSGANRNFVYNGNTALTYAQSLGFLSIVDLLKG